MRVPWKPVGMEKMVPMRADMVPWAVGFVDGRVISPGGGRGFWGTEKQRKGKGREGET